MSTTRVELEKFLNDILMPEYMNDYGPNGLQIEGSDSISKVAFAVTASKHSIDEAVKLGADTLIVHHGLFWKFHQTRTITGPFAKRVIPLIKNEINLFGYHLPLDGNQDFGNARQIGDMIGLTDYDKFGEFKRTTTGIQGKLEHPLKVTELKKKLEKVLNHDVVVASYDHDAEIKTVGIITGGANSNWSDAYNMGLDAYITGEMSEHDWHESQESGVHMFAGGHYATEQFGIRALMEKVDQNFDVDCIFIASQNPA